MGEVAANGKGILPVEEDVITRTAREVSAIMRYSGFERRCKIGELIITNLFCGSRLAWRARSSSSYVGFRRLSSLLHGTVSKSELHRSVNTRLLCQDLDFITNSQHLSISHLDAVDGLPRNIQAKLLKEAELHNWSVRQLQCVRRKLNLTDGARRGRPARSTSQRIVSRGALVVRVLQAMERDLTRDVSQVGLDPMSIANLKSCVDSIQQTYASLEKILQEWQTIEVGKVA